MYFAALVVGMSGRCSLFARHHIHTFDGVLYGFPGDCSYLLAGDCKHRSFTLLGESPRWWRGSAIASCSLQDLQIYPFIFSLTLSVAAIWVQVLMCHPQLIWLVAKELEWRCFWGTPLNSACPWMVSCHKEMKGCIFVKPHLLCINGFMVETFDIWFFLQVIAATRISRRVCRHRAWIL